MLTALMYVGRVGTITFATSLMLSEQHTLYRHPEEHPIVG
jgi:trk system potassium uptake protein TrkH